MDLLIMFNTSCVVQCVKRFAYRRPMSESMVRIFACRNGLQPEYSLINLFLL